MRIVKVYNEEFKRAAVKKLLLPGGQGTTRTAEFLGIPATTLVSWKQKYAIDSVMKKSNKSAESQSWSPEKKLKAIIETFSMNELQLGEFLRKNGLHSSDLERWKRECINTLKSGVGRPKKDPEIFELRKKERALERDLRRKDMALAEMSARIVLLKKSHLLCGGNEEDE